MKLELYNDEHIYTFTDGADLDFTTTTTPDESLVYDYHIYKGVRA